MLQHLLPDAWELTSDIGSRVAGSGFVQAQSRLWLEFQTVFQNQQGVFFAAIQGSQIYLGFSLVANRKTGTSMRTVAIKRLRADASIIVLSDLKAEYNMPIDGKCMH